MHLLSFISVDVVNEQRTMFYGAGFFFPLVIFDMLLILHTVIKMHSPFEEIREERQCMNMRMSRNVQRYLEGHKRHQMSKRHACK